MRCSKHVESHPTFEQLLLIQGVAVVFGGAELALG